MEVTDIIIYPIKSMCGIQLQEAECLERGLRHDRRMMLVDEEGNFITQREYHKMAGIGAALTSNGFQFFLKNDQSRVLDLPHDAGEGNIVPVRVWNHRFSAVELPDYGTWFSKVLNTSVRLVKMKDEYTRSKSLIKAPRKTLLSMADGYPYLIISDASLQDLNQRLDEAVPMNRFRPNIVIKGGNPYIEEELDHYSIGNAKFRMIKPCARCSMITIDQKTTKKLVEPLKTLSLYKRSGNKVYFGMNAVCIEPGKISVGDAISIF